MSGARSPSAEAAAPPSKTSGLLYGLGLGGFVDGILLHEVLQWHHMVSSEYPTDTVAGLEVNTLADGLFHVATWFLRDDLGGPLSWDLGSWRSGRCWSSEAGCCTAAVGPPGDR